MTSIARNLQAVRERLTRAAERSGRAASEIALLAVSKTFPASYIEQARAAGQRLFGENYVQEAVKKITALEALDAEWHFIGPIQSNKTALIASHFAWVHSVSRGKIAERLNAGRSADLPPLNVCIQVNLSGEDTKSGVFPGDERALADTIAHLPRLKLRGLMAIPEPTPDVATQRKRFALLRELNENLRAHGHGVDTLSMGMSEDFEAAIAEGATIVRIGTAIFGARS